MSRLYRHSADPPFDTLQDVIDALDDLADEMHRRYEQTGHVEFVKHEEALDAMARSLEDGK